MYLGDLIARLESEPADKVIRLGFAHPHSYRGVYAHVAFEPVSNCTVGDMLAAARSAHGSTYEGWKGGMYTMGEYTECFLADEGRVGDELSARLLEYMLADTERP